jgi:flagellar biosynthesis/type III secretory pathway protein FliH
MRAVAEREHMLQHAELEIVELAMQISRRIVNAAIDVDPELVVEVCRGAMRKAFQREHLVVVAHPDDLAMLRAAGPQMADELGGIHSLDFVEERRMDRGSVVVRTPAGEIDATIDGKAEKIEDSLRELVQERRAARRSQAA